MRNATPLILLATLALRSQAQSECKPSPSASAGCFALSFIDAMASAHRRAVASMPRYDSTSVADEASAAMYSIRMGRDGLDEAARALQPYRGTSDSTLAMALQITLLSLGSLRDLGDQQEAEIKNALDGKAMGSPSEQASRLADQRVQRRKAAEGLILGASAVAQALVEPVPANRQRMRLAIDSTFRERLRAAITIGFGANGLTAKNDQFSSDFVPPVKALSDFLNQPWPLRPKAR